MTIAIQKRFGRRECPACATEVEANHNRCPICGYEFPNLMPGQRRFKLTGALLMLGLILALLLLPLLF